MSLEEAVHELGHWLVLLRYGIVGIPGLRLNGGFVLADIGHLSVGQQIRVFLAGGLANGIGAGLVLVAALVTPTMASHLYVFAGLNAWMCVYSLYSCRRESSDAQRLRYLFREKKPLTGEAETRHP